MPGNTLMGGKGAPLAACLPHPGRGPVAGLPHCLATKPCQVRTSGEASLATGTPATKQVLWSCREAPAASSPRTVSGREVGGLLRASATAPGTSDTRHISRAAACQVVRRA